MVADSFSSIIGHARVIELLHRDAPEPAQAYLFVGPESVGKALLARQFAAAILCASHGVHDVECRSCRLVAAGSHPDVSVIEPEGATSLGVEQIRSVVTRAALRPVEGPRTVFLLPDAGTMTEQAANALLKTLEEPSAAVVFLLVAESEDDFPATVASRCRTVHVGRVPLAELVAALQARGLGVEEAASVAVVSGGRPGLALALMNRPEVAEFRDLWLSIPGRVTPRPGDGQRLAMQVLEEIGPLAERSVSSEMTKDAQQKARRRSEQSLLVNGLEILASWYADSASLQMGGPVKNSDLSLAAFTDVNPRKAVMSAEHVLDAVVDIQGSLRRELVLATLFTGLGSQD
jgi:DNA polymerase III delta' subunit